MQVGQFIVSLAFRRRFAHNRVVEASVSNRVWFSIKALAVRAVGAFCLNQHTDIVLDRSSIVKENVLMSVQESFRP